MTPKICIFCIDLHLLNVKYIEVHFGQNHESSTSPDSSIKEGRVIAITHICMYNGDEQ